MDISAVWILLLCIDHCSTVCMCLPESQWSVFSVLRSRKCIFASSRLLRSLTHVEVGCLSV